MDEAEIWKVIEQGRAELADLFETFDAERWTRATLCEGWTMREMAAHLSVGSRIGVSSALAGLVRARGDFNRFVDITARRDATRPTGELVAELRAAARSRRLAPGQSLTNAVLDVLVHAQDVAVPLGLDWPMDLPAARLAAADTWRRSFPFRARRRLRGFRLVATDIAWAAGDGSEVRGPISALLMLLTGREAALDRLTGPGAEALVASLAGRGVRS